MRLRHKASVIEKRATCTYGYDVGDTFVFDGTNTCPYEFCGKAFHAIFPEMFRTAFSENATECLVVCPEASGLVFRVEKVVTEEPNDPSASVYELLAARRYAAVRKTCQELEDNMVLEAAHWCRNQGAYQVAAELYILLEARGRMDDRIRLCLAGCYGGSRQYAAALSELRRCEDGILTRGEGLGLFAYVLEKNGRRQEARRTYERALNTFRARDPWTCSHYAHFIANDGEKDAAEALYRTTLESPPSFVWALKKYGRLLHERGRSDEAVDLFERHLRRSNQSPSVLYGYLEHLLLTDARTSYEAIRQELNIPSLPSAYGIALDLLDYFAVHILSCTTDEPRRAGLIERMRWYPQTIDVDIDELTEKCARESGDMATWQTMLEHITK